MTRTATVEEMNAAHSEANEVEVAGLDILEQVEGRLAEIEPEPEAAQSAQELMNERAGFEVQATRLQLDVKTAELGIVVKERDFAIRSSKRLRSYLDELIVLAMRGSYDSDEPDLIEQIARSTNLMAKLG